MGVRRLLMAVCLAGQLCAPTRAELVVLVGGHVLKVDEYQLEGDRALLKLPSGGSLRVPLMNVERVVDDEIGMAEDESLEKGESITASIDFDSGARIPPIPFGDLIHAAARRHNMNVDLVAAVVRAESAFDPAAVSSAGASGLMQLMPATAARFGVQDSEIFDPEANIDAGVRYLRWLANRFDDELSLVLAGYNAGEATVDRYEGVPPFRETRGYIRKIYSFLGLSEEG